MGCDTTTQRLSNAVINEARRPRPGATSRPTARRAASPPHTVRTLAEWGLIELAGQLHSTADGELLDAPPDEQALLLDPYWQARGAALIGGKLGGGDTNLRGNRMTTEQKLAIHLSEISHKLNDLSVACSIRRMLRTWW